MKQVARNIRRSLLCLTPALIAVCGVAGAGPARADDPIAIGVSHRTQAWVRPLAEAFGKSHPGVSIKPTLHDSTSGIDELFKGNVAAVIMARPATEEEIRRGRQVYKKRLVGIPVAGDAVILFVRPDNTSTSMTLDQIKDVFTYRIREWSALGVSMVESAAEEAVRKRMDSKSQGPLINRHSPEDHSDSVEVLIARTIGRGRLTRGRRTYDNQRDLIHAVGADRFGLGFAGRGYAQGIKTLAVQRNAESSAVVPTPETIRDRTYPLAHYQYMYFAGRPEGFAKAFLTFILSEEGQRTMQQLDTGAVSLPFMTE